MSRTLALGLTAFALLTAVTACSTSTSSSSGTSGASGASGGKAAATKKSTIKIDACTLLKDSEIEAIIGKNSGGHVGAGVGESICEWDNEDNYYSVTLSLGNKDTALGGKLPDSDTQGTTPGPDGIVFASDNTASYVDQDRACYIQVSTLKATKDRATAVRLIKLVKSRTAGKF